MSKAEYAERQKCEAEFLRWWLAERDHIKFQIIPAIALTYVESEARKAWMMSRGITP